MTARELIGVLNRLHPDTLILRPMKDTPVKNLAKEIGVVSVYWVQECGDDDRYSCHCDASPADRMELAVLLW